MKIVLLIAGIIVAVVLLVVAIGMLLPKQHVASRSAFFKAPPERIFALIAGPQDWRNDVARFEVLDATHAKTRETWKDGTVIEYLVVKSEPPFVLERRIASEDLPFGGRWTFAIESDGGGSRLRITENGEVYNPLFRFMAKFIFGHTRTIEDYLRSLGQALKETPEIQA
jgi:hypothetical protein